MIRRHFSFLTAFKLSHGHSVFTLKMKHWHVLSLEALSFTMEITTLTSYDGQSAQGFGLRQTYASVLSSYQSMLLILGLLKFFNCFNKTLIYTHTHKLFMYTFMYNLQALFC